MAAAKAFGDIDFLILNGDILDHSGDPSKFANIYIICSEITGGNIPVVFSRGNHDLRGNYAEKFADYIENKDAFSDNYKQVCQLTHNVHTCMDLIKESAKIKYPI